MSSRGVILAIPAPDDLSRLALAALCELVRERGPEFDYLERYRVSDWAEAFSRALKHPSESDAPLLELAALLSLTPAEVIAIALACVVEEQALAGRAIAHLQAPIAASRPTVALVATAMAHVMETSERSPISELWHGAAIRSGALISQPDTAPFAEQTLRVPAPLRAALSGQDGIWPGCTIGLGSTPEIPLPPSTVAESQRRALALVSGESTLAIRSGSVAEARSTASAVASALDLRPAFLDSSANLAGIGVWLTMRQLLPVFCLDLAPGERRMLPDIAFYSGPVLAICGPEGTIESSSGPVVSWRSAVPPRAEREQLWARGLGDPVLAQELAAHHRHGAGRIEQIARLARHHARAGQRDVPVRADFARAAWIAEGGTLSSLAQPLDDPIPDDALVLTPPVQKQMEHLLLRCRMRDSLAENLGIAATARYRPGVRALLVGPSGTGKTLAAGWLATNLGVPMFRVDLASVTSKYIGETEKNLSELFARAEQSDIILLFDEADSLFGKRTEVREANDRFANAQTNYLLQRLESFDGIALLTSNSRTRFDSAFFRRLDLIVEFLSPGADARRQLWLAHLGSRHGLTQVQINQIAASSVDLTGGHIRNAVLMAAAIANDRGSVIGYADIVDGLTAELRKLGKPVPVELT